MKAPALTSGHRRRDGRPHDGVDTGYPSAPRAIRIIDRVRHGLDALSGGYTDMIEAGVIDAAKVTRSALQSAVSIAALLLTTEALIAEELVGQPGSVLAPGFGDLAEGIARPSSPAGSPAP